MVSIRTAFTLTKPVCSWLRAISQKKRKKITLPPRQNGDKGPHAPVSSSTPLVGFLSANLPKRIRRFPGHLVNREYEIVLNNN